MIIKFILAMKHNTFNTENNFKQNREIQIKLLSNNFPCELKKIIPTLFSDK